MMDTINMPVIPRRRGTYAPKVKGAFVLVGAAVAAFGFAAYIRYGLVEPSAVGLSCDTGLNTTVCIIRRVFINLFTLNVFGIGAIAAALLALVRPATLIVAVALVLGIMGCVLYNTGLSAVALSLLPLVLARRAPHKEFQQD
jgi:predicted neutral ceramidase superfamily lipid hydrolase